MVDGGLIVGFLCSGLYAFVASLRMVFALFCPLVIPIFVSFRNFVISPIIIIFCFRWGNHH